MSELKGILLSCKACGYVWKSKLKNKLPKSCPSCKRYDWKTYKSDEVKGKSHSALLISKIIEKEIKK